ncbi:MAG: metalloregulator ArsR/SmtB family transcription factor [Ruminococcaceae bacterium]|nr:metalloregulator ArsR/SmtB family transcription factor [Oscillospiraceae bacterium]
MENTLNAVVLFKALGDESRLSILRMLLEGESYVELIASRLELTSATVSHHLKKLEAAGLVECHRTQFYMIYSVKRDFLDESLVSLIGTLPKQDDDTKYKQGIIDAFFEYGRLKALPAQRKKREVVLRYILEPLETERDYTEKEINRHIIKYNDDYCTIRREMIAFGIMERKKSADGSGDVYIVTGD